MDVTIDQGLVRALLADQHPDLAGLEIREVGGGWDNMMWRLGDELAVRLPRLARAPALLRSEQRWLPGLASRLPLPVPVPVRIGEPSALFPSTWTVTRWVAGVPADQEPITRPESADSLGKFLRALHRSGPEGAPTNPTHGGPLSTHAPGVGSWLAVLTSADRAAPAPAPTAAAPDATVPDWPGESPTSADRPAPAPTTAAAAPDSGRRGATGLASVDRAGAPASGDHVEAAAPGDRVEAVRRIWDDALAAPEWDSPPAWIHGDLHPANVVVDSGMLSGVIDFGELCAGDPAADLAAAWVLLPAGTAPRFLDAYGRADDAMIRRARGWAVLRALVLISVGQKWGRGLPGGKQTWGPAGRAALERVLSVPTAPTPVSGSGRGPVSPV